MLPPVLASANQVTTATEAKSRPDQIATTRPATVAQVATSARIDQNSAIAGQLNIMLLSGPERMSQNLAALADVLGFALKIERQTNESLNNYMGRLIDGIAALPPGDRAKLQKLLSQAFAGLQLRTLIEAMASPSGPERATLALYLELYRQKDGDGATRSVISSYRELAGEGRSNVLSTARPAAANDSLRPAAEAAPMTTKSVSQSPLAPSTPPLDRQNSGGERPTSPTIQGPQPSSALLRPQAPGAATVLQVGMGQGEPRLFDTASTKPPHASAAERGMSETASTSPAVRGLSPSILSSNDRRETPRVSGLTPPSANGLAEDRGEQGGDVTGASAKAAPAGSSVLMPTTEPGLKPSFPQGGGWLAELLQTDLVRTLLALKNLSTDPLMDEPQGKALHTATSGEPAPPDAASISEGSSDETELMPRMPEARGAADAADTKTPPQPLPLTEQVAIRPILTREGVPLPFVSYMFEDDVRWEEETDEEDEREAEDQRHPPDEEQEDVEAEERSDETATLTTTTDQTGDDAAAPVLLQGDVTKAQALPAPSDTAVQLPPEPAHELYLRMAGLN